MVVRLAQGINLRAGLLVIDLARSTDEGDARFGPLPTPEEVSKQIRSSDLVGRLEGGHIGVLLVHAEAQGVASTAASIRQRLDEAAHRAGLPPVTLGLAALPSGEQSVAAVVAQAMADAARPNTTLIRAALESFKSPNARLVYMNNPLLSRVEFFELLASGFELSRDARRSKTQFLLELSHTLAERHEAGFVTALIIDEAQSLPLELMEEVRLLANIEAATEKLLPLVLAGQGELTKRLNEIPLRQLKQRIGLRCVLAPLDLRETALYIATRVSLVGGTVSQLFASEAVRLIYQSSGGIPRVISVICDNALLGAFAVGQRRVDAELVLEVCRDFDLQQLTPASQFGPSPTTQPLRAASQCGPNPTKRIAPSGDRRGRPSLALSHPSLNEGVARNGLARKQVGAETVDRAVQPTRPFVLLPAGMA